MSGIRLVPVAPEHAEAIQRLVAGDRTILDQTRLPDPYPEDGAATWIAYSQRQRELGKEHNFAILNEDGEVVGTCGLRIAGPAAELGYWVGKSYRGRGYAPAAARQALVFAFTEAGLERVFALALERNAASRRVLERAGLKQVGWQPAEEEKWAGLRHAVCELRREDWQR